MSRSAKAKELQRRWRLPKIKERGKCGHPNSLSINKYRNSLSAILHPASQIIGGPVFKEGVSRILFPAARRRQGHSFICRTKKIAQPSLCGRCGTPGTITDGPPGPLFCLAPDWVFPAPSVALGAVGSYPAISPWPPGSRSPRRWYIFCDTIRRSGLSPQPPPLSRGILPDGVRTFLHAPHQINARGTANAHSPKTGP